MRIELPVVRTPHFRRRAAQRGLSKSVLSFVMIYGRDFPANGATSLTVLDRDLPPELRRSAVAREARGWVIVQKLGCLLTCYRRQEPSRFLRRKHQLPSYARPCRSRGSKGV